MSGILQRHISIVITEPACCNTSQGPPHYQDKLASTNFGDVYIEYVRNFHIAETLPAHDVTVLKHNFFLCCQKEWKAPDERERERQSRRARTMQPPSAASRTNASQRSTQQHNCSPLDIHSPKCSSPHFIARRIGGRGQIGEKQRQRT